MAVLGAGEEKERVQSLEGGVERPSLQTFCISHLALLPNSFFPPGKASPTPISMGPGPVETASSPSKILHPFIITLSIKLHWWKQNNRKVTRKTTRRPWHRGYIVLCQPNNQAQTQWPYQSWPLRSQSYSVHPSMAYIFRLHLIPSRGSGAQKYPIILKNL